MVKNILSSNSYLIFHNSNWSYEFFKEKLNLENKDLIIKNIVVYESVKEDYRVKEDAYKLALKEVGVFLKDTNGVINLVNLGVNSISIITVVLIELFYNKFKKEYFSFLNVINC